MMRPPSPPRLRRVLAVAVAAALLAVAAGAQIEEEDLAAPELEPAPSPATAVAASDAPLDAELVRLLAEAEQLFQSADQPAALPLLGRVVARLEPRAAAGVAGPAERDLLARALSYRAETRLNLGDAVAAEADLRQLLAARPDHRLDARLVSPKLLEVFQRLRRETVGELAMTVDPLDAVVRVDGVPVAHAGEPVGVAAGTRTVEVTRPGYAPQTLVVDVAAGDTETLAVTLERESAVVRVHSRPSGAEVALDREVKGLTSGVAPEGFLPEGTAAVYPRQEFSDEMVIEGVAPGLHLLEVRKPGYRPYRAELQIADLLDYPMPPIVLEEERGRVVLLDVPAGATILVDGTPATPENPGSSRPQVSLPPGEHRLTVSAGRSKLFSTRFTLGDRQALEVPVRLRPGLALLGVLGGDASAEEGLARGLQTALERSGKWAVLDRGDEARPLLAAAGVDAAALRRAADEGAAADVDWAALQRRVDAALPGLVYAVAVLSSDLLATEADLWVWSAAPGPARPERLRFTLGQPAELDRVAAAFETSVRLRTPALGALVVDSLAAPHPVVFDVTPGGPAAEAGLQLGDMVVAVAGVPVLSHAALEERLLAAEIGEPLAFAVQSPQGPRTLTVTLGGSPTVVAGRDTGLLAPLAFTELVLLGERAAREDAWLVELNQAVILVDNGEWEEAVRRLRDLDAPPAPHGVGRATVDYWLGVALAAARPDLQSAAADALARAAAVPGARLHHADGAYLAPRAQARLRALGR